MKMNGINETGEISFKNVPDDKLIKLRDVAADHLQETFKEYMEAREHVLQVRSEMVARGIITDF